MIKLTFRVFKSGILVQGLGLECGVLRLMVWGEWQPSHIQPLSLTSMNVPWWGTYILWNFHSQGTFNPGTFIPLELLLPGNFVPCERKFEERTFSWTLKIKVCTLDIVPLHESSPQKHSGIAYVLTDLSFTTCSICNQNEPYLPLPLQLWLVLIYRPRRDGRLSWPG